MDFRIIPGTCGFTATQDGRIFGPDGVQRAEYTNGDGYLTASVKLEDGRWQTFGIQRLVALAWIPCPGNPSDFTVNHIDTDVTNNYYTNLEWVTVQVNNLHASLMRYAVDRPTIYMVDSDGEYSYLDNLHMAGQVLSVDVSLAWDMVRDGLEVNGVKLYPITKHTIIPDQLRAETIKERDANGRQPEVAVKVKDIETDCVLHFPTLGDAGRHYGVSASHIYQSMSIDRVRIFKRKYLIVKAEMDFPELDTATLERSISSGGKRTWGWNSKTNTLYVADSASQLVRLTGLSKKAVTTRLKRDGFGEVGDWVIAYEANSNKMVERMKGSSLP